jgi:tetratricopeptide (TPR) repeat protein
MIKICPECLNINVNKDACSTCGFPFGKKVIGKIEDFLFYDCIELINIGNVKEAKEKIEKRLSEEKNIKLEMLMQRIDSILSTISDSEILAEKAMLMFQNQDYYNAANAITKAIAMNPSPRYFDISTKIENVLLKLEKEKIASDKFKQGVASFETGYFTKGLSLIKEAITIDSENLTYVSEFKNRIEKYMDSIEQGFRESFENGDLNKCEFIIEEGSVLLADNIRFSKISQILHEEKNNIDKKKKNKKMIVFLFLGVVLIVFAWFLIGKYNDKKNWENVQREGTIKAYQRFLENFSKSNYVKDAEEKLSELMILDSTQWKKFMIMPSGHTIHEYIDSLSPYGGLHLEEAEFIADSIDWVAIRNSGVTAVYEKYLLDHPNSRFNSLVRQKISLDVSPDERISLIQFMNDYFAFYAAKDLETVMNYYGPIIPVFGPKKNITKADLRLLLENDLKTVLESKFTIDTSSFVVTRMENGNLNIVFYSDAYTTRVDKSSIDQSNESEIQQTTYFTNMQWMITIDSNRKIINYTYKIISEQPINQ